METKVIDLPTETIKFDVKVTKHWDPYLGIEPYEMFFGIKDSFSKALTAFLIEEAEQAASVWDVPTAVPQPSTLFTFVRIKDKTFGIIYKLPDGTLQSDVYFIEFIPAKCPHVHVRGPHPVHKTCSRCYREVY